MKLKNRTLISSNFQQNITPACPKLVKTTAHPSTRLTEDRTIVTFTCENECDALSHSQELVCRSGSWSEQPPSCGDAGWYLNLNLVVYKRRRRQFSIQYVINNIDWSLFLCEFVKNGRHLLTYTILDNTPDKVCSTEIIQDTPVPNSTALVTDL